MAENINIQTGIYNYLASRTDLKGQGEEVVLSAVRQAGFTEEEIKSAQNTISAFGYGYSQIGEKGLSVELVANAPKEILDGVKKYKDESGNHVTLTLENGYPTKKTVSKNGKIVSTSTYTYLDDICAVKTKNADGSITSVLCSDVDEQGNIPDENFAYSETKKKNGTMVLVYMTPNGMTKQEISKNMRSTTVYATGKYSEIQKNKAKKIYSEVINSRGNAVIEDGSGKYAQIILLPEETISDLAKKYGTTVEQIKALNPSIKDINKVKAGDVILLQNKSKVSELEILKRKSPEQVLYERECKRFEKAYENVITKQNKQANISFPLDNNGTKVNKFIKLEDAAKYVLSLNGIVNPTKEDINICTKELIILNSVSDEKDINKKSKNALANINAGKLVYVGTSDYSEMLSRWGFKPDAKNYNTYQKLYAVIEYLSEKTKSKNSKEVKEAKELLRKLTNILTEDVRKKTPEDFKYKVLMECGLNVYEDERAEEVEDILRRRSAISISHFVTECIYKSYYGIYNNNGAFVDATKDVENSFDWIINKVGLDITTGDEVVAAWKHDTEILNKRLNSDFRNEKEFKQFFKKYFGVEYNKANIDAVAEFIEKNKNEDILNNKEFKKLYQKAFNLDLKYFMRNIKTLNISATLGNIELMVLAFKGIGSSAAMQEFSAITASSLSNMGLTGRYLQVAHSAIVSATSFATYTALENTASLVLSDEKLNLQAVNRILGNTFESMKFGAFAGAFNVVAVAPLTQQKTVGYAVEKLQYSMKPGSAKTGTQIMEMFYQAQSPVIKSKTGQAIYSFGANVVGFTAYNTAKDMFENPDLVKELGFGNYLGQQFLAQLEGLATFEGVKMLLAFAMSGKIGMESAMSIHDGLEPFESIKNIKVETIKNSKGEICYKVSSPNGESAIIKNMGEVVGLCQQLMVTELNVRKTFNSSLEQSEIKVETEKLAFEPPKTASAEVVTKELVRPNAAETPIELKRAMIAEPVAEAKPSAEMTGVVLENVKSKYEKILADKGLPSAEIAEKLALVTEKNKEVADIIFADKDFPETEIETILDLVNEVDGRIDLIKALCANKDFPKEFVSYVWYKTADCNPKLVEKLCTKTTIHPTSIRTITSRLEGNEKASKLFLDICEDETFSNKDITNITEGLNNVNVDFAVILCADKNFPRKEIGYIISQTRRKNLELAKLMYVEKFPPEFMFDALQNATETSIKVYNKIKNDNSIPIEMKAEIIETGREDLIGAIPRLMNQYNNMLKTPQKYINGKMSDEKAIEHIRFFVKYNMNDVLQLAEALDKEALDNLFRRRLNNVTEYIYNAVRSFNFEDWHVLKEINGACSVDGKPLMPTQKVEAIDLIKSYKECGISVSKLLPTEGKIDLGGAKIKLFTHIMELSGLTKEEIARIPKEKLVAWDTTYAHLMIQEIQNPAMKDVLRAANFDNFERYIHDVSNEYGKSNARTQELYRNQGMNYEAWLHPDKSSEITFKAMDENHEKLIQISDLLVEDLETLRQNPALRGFIDKQFPKCIKEGQIKIPQEYLTSKEKLSEFTENIIKQLDSVWKRAEGNANHENPERAAKARGTLTILDHLNQRIDDISKVEDFVSTKSLDLTIKMWDRVPQKDIFQGNYSTCCIGMGGGNGSAMPHYLLNTSYNMIELVDNNSGRVVGNALCYFVTGSDGNPKFIIDNIEINNSAKPSVKVGIELRQQIANYADRIAREVTGRDDVEIFMSGNNNDVHTNDLQLKIDRVSFLGETDCNEIYMDLYHDESANWISHDVDMYGNKTGSYTRDCKLLKLIPERPTTPATGISGVETAIPEIEVEGKAELTEQQEALPEEINGTMYDQSSFKYFNKAYSKITETEELVNMLKEWVSLGSRWADSYRVCKFEDLKRTIDLIIEDAQKSGALDDYDSAIFRILDSKYMKETKDFKLIEQIVTAQKKGKPIDAEYIVRLNPLMDNIDNENFIRNLKRMLAIKTNDDFLNIDNILYISEELVKYDAKYVESFLQAIEKPGANIQAEYKNLICSRVIENIKDNPRILKIFTDYVKERSIDVVETYVKYELKLDRAYDNNLPEAERVVKIKNKILIDLDVESDIATIRQTLSYIKDTELKAKIEKELQKCLSTYGTSLRNLKEYGLPEIQELVDIANIFDEHYTNIKTTKSSNNLPYHREFIQYLEKSNPSLAGKINSNPSIIEKIFRSTSYKTLRADFLQDMKIGKMVDFCKNHPDSELADYFYRNYYIKSSNLPANLKEQCLSISEQFGTRVFLSANTKDAGKCLQYIKSELSEWIRMSNGLAKMPPTIDMQTSKRDYIDDKSAYGQSRAAGFSEMGRSGAISLDGNVYNNLVYALRHELTHTNDFIPDAPLPENPQQYRQEFLNAGISANHVNYAFNNSDEFIAVAAEGDFSKYSPSFKQLLVQLGLPRWALNMRPKEVVAKNPVETDIKPIKRSHDFDVIVYDSDNSAVEKVSHEVYREAETRPEVSPENNRAMIQNFFAGKNLGFTESEYKLLKDFVKTEEDLKVISKILNNTSDVSQQLKGTDEVVRYREFINLIKDYPNVSSDVIVGLLKNPNLTMRIREGNVKFNIFREVLELTSKYPKYQEQLLSELSNPEFVFVRKTPENIEIGDYNVKNNIHRMLSDPKFEKIAEIMLEAKRPITSFFDSDFAITDLRLANVAYEKLNTLMNGAEAPQLKELKETFKSETGVDLRIDNNVLYEDAQICIEEISEAVKIFKAAGKEPPKEIYLTKFVPDRSSGVFSRSGENNQFNIAVKPKPENRAKFRHNVLHETAHMYDRNALNSTIDHELRFQPVGTKFKFQNGEKTWETNPVDAQEFQELAKKYVSKYSSTTLHEFCAELGTMLLEGKIVVEEIKTQNKDIVGVKVKVKEPFTNINGVKFDKLTAKDITNIQKLVEYYFEVGGQNFSKSNVVEDSKMKTANQQFLKHELASMKTRSADGMANPRFTPAEIDDFLTKFTYTDKNGNVKNNAENIVKLVKLDKYKDMSANEIAQIARQYGKNLGGLVKLGNIPETNDKVLATKASDSYVITETKTRVTADGKKQTIEVKKLKPEVEEQLRIFAKELRADALGVENEIVKFMEVNNLTTENYIFTHRAKSEQSLFDKMKNYLLDSDNADKTVANAKKAVMDAVGTRTIIPARDYTQHPEVQALLAEGKRKEAIDLSMKMQSEEIIENIGNLLTKLKAQGVENIGVLRFSNYMGNEGMPYISERQLVNLKELIDVEFDNLTDDAIAVNEKNGIELKKEHFAIKVRESGYTAFQVNFKTKDGHIFEWQFRGDMVNEFAEAEHVPYDLRTDKDIISANPKAKEILAPIKEILSVENMTDSDFALYNKYLTAYYKYCRELELGFKDAKLETPFNSAKFDSRLKAENLILLHEYSEILKTAPESKIPELVAEYKSKLIK